MTPLTQSEMWEFWRTKRSSVTKVWPRPDQATQYIYLVFSFSCLTYQSPKVQHGQMRPGLNQCATTLPPRGRTMPEAQRGLRHRETSLGFVGIFDDSLSLWILQNGSSFHSSWIETHPDVPFLARVNSSTPIAGDPANIDVATALRREERRWAQLQQVLSEEVQRKLTKLRMTINSTSGACDNSITYTSLLTVNSRCPLADWNPLHDLRHSHRLRGEISGHYRPNRRLSTLEKGCYCLPSIMDPHFFRNAS